MVHGGMRIRAVLVALLVTTGGVATGLAAPDDDVLDELRKLRDRVEDLEAWKADRQARDAAPSNLSAAIEQYLGNRAVEGASGGIVVAPRSKKIELGGMVRVRGEMRRRTPQGPDVEGRHHNEFFLGRVRLHARAQIEDDLAAYVELQDARIWGSEASTAADGTGVDLSQGYIDFLRMFGGTTDARLGRQAVALSDQRFIGALEWANPGRRFDGLTVNTRCGDARYTFFGYRTAEGFPFDPADDDQDVAGIWSTFPDLFGERTTFEAFAIYLNDTRDFGMGVHHTGFSTLGVRAHGGPDGQGWDWDTQIAAQRGELAGNDLDAWAARGEVGYRFRDGKGAPRLGFEYDFATGDEKIGDGDSEQFQVLFPTNHGYYGIHDLAAWSNQRAYSVNFSTGLGDKWSMKTAYWRFQVDQEAGGWVSASGAPVRLPQTSGSSRSLGHEFDLTVKYQQSPRVTWEAGWAHFWAGSYARGASPDVNDDSDWFYLQTLVTF